MAKRSSQIDSKGPNAEATAYNTVFVDTSLDTHLVMIISPSDTVSDFKKKMLLQHSESFPRMGGIIIHSLQVKRQGHFYHLPDSMLVRCAFDGSKRTWFLFVEASSSQEDDKEQLSRKPDASEKVGLFYLQNHSEGEEYNLLADDPLKSASERVPQAVQTSPRNFSGEISRDIDIEVRHLQDDCQKELSSAINKHLALPGATLEKRVSENAASPEDVNSRDNNKTIAGSSLDELPSAAKKHKIEDIANVGVTVKKKPKIEKKKDPLVDASGEVPSDMQTRQTDIGGQLYDTLSSDPNCVSMFGAPKTSQSEPTAEKSNKLGRKEVNSDQSNSRSEENVSKQEMVPSLQEVKEDNLVTGVGSKKGKKKQKKTLFVPHDQAVISECIPELHGSDFHANLNSEAPEPNKSEGHEELVLNNGPEVMFSEICKPLDQGEVDGTNEKSIPSSNLLGAYSPTEAVDSVGNKRKKTRTKKQAPGILAKGLNNNRELSFEPRPEVILPKGNKSLDSGKATVNDKVSGFTEMSLNNKDGLEAGKSGGSRKKKSLKKPPTANDDFTSVEHSNSISDSPAKDFEGHKELSFNHGPEVISSKGSKPLDLGEATVNGNESGFAAQALDNEDGLKAGKSGGGQKKKRAKKHANSVCDSPAKHFTSEAQGNQNILSCTEGKETSKEESRNASTSGASKGNEASRNKEIVSPLAETDETWENAKDLDENLREAKNDQSKDTNALQDRPVKVQANEVQHLQQDHADKLQENAGNIKKKVKKKTKRNQNTAAETHSNLKSKEKIIGIEELAASGDKLGGFGHPYDTTNISVSAETRIGNRSAISELMLEKNAGVKSKFSTPEQVLENNPEMRPETMSNIENIDETSEAVHEGINFRHYFVPGEHQSEVASAGKVKEALHSADTKRKAKKSTVVSEGSLRSNQQSQNKSYASDNQLEEPSPDAKRNEDIPWTNKETSKASGNIVKASNSRDVDKVKTPCKAAKPVVANGSGSSRTTPSWLAENNGSVTASSSSSSAKGSKRVLQDTGNRKQQSGFNNDSTSARKLSTKNDGDIVKGSKQGKSLLSTPGAIFSDGSSESSGDENGIGNSDASTRTPSDNSSSSGYSDSESELSRDSRGNGSENAKRKDASRKSTLNSKFPDPKDMSMDMILRSSKRFKKAKLTASQSQEADTESQPVDFVPDSQAN